MHVMVVAVFVLAMSVLSACGLHSVDIKSAPAFIVGQRYSVVWDCLPIQPVPCYGEVLEVLKVWRNGWLTVRDTDGGTWNVNPARAIGYQLYGVQTQVTR